MRREGHVTNMRE